jgi:uncharacterized protein involved in type VI secretion and phage assembly
MEQLLSNLTEQSQTRYYGKYRGYVANNRDDEKRGRLRLTVPEVLGDTVTGWALPCLPFGGLADQGLFMIPEVDSAVWVEFEAGDLNRPIWTGVFWRQSSDVPSEAQKDEPTTRVLKTPSGHILQFDDAAGEEKFVLHHPAEAEMTIDEQGSITLTDGGGSTVTMDASAGKLALEDSNGNSITMDATGIKIKDKNGNQIELAAAGITIKGTKLNIG